MVRARAGGGTDVAAGRRLPPVHPGEILRDEFLRPLGLSVYRLARSLKISRPRLDDIVLGRRGITIDTALRLGRYFGTTPEFWVNLQARHEEVKFHFEERYIGEAPIAEPTWGSAEARLDEIKRS